MHPMKQAGCGGVVPNCPGAARVEAGGDYPMESENPSHRREKPLAPGSTPNEPGLITGRLLLPVLCLRWDSEAGVTSPDAGLGEWYGDPGVPSRHDPPLGVAGMVQRKGKPIQSVSAQLQELPKGVTMLNQSS